MGSRLEKGAVAERVLSVLTGTRCEKNTNREHVAHVGADTAVPLLLEALCAHEPLRSLETKQALVKQLAELLQFVLAFDEQKLKNPSIQNDFSYYRRTLSRLKMNEVVWRTQKFISFSINHGACRTTTQLLCQTRMPTGCRYSMHTPHRCCGRSASPRLNLWQRFGEHVCLRHILMMSIE